jgi:hypothetical protein
MGKFLKRSLDAFAKEITKSQIQQADRVVSLKKSWGKA